MTVTDKTLNETLTNIQSMSPDQIALVVDAVKLRRNRINNQAMHTVQVGDSVQFTGRNNNVVSGKVTKKAIKYVTVDTGMGRWKVPANMLEVL